MSEVQFLASVVQYGPWVASISLLIYIFATKLGPQGLTAFFEERKALRREQIGAYERFITAYAETSKYIASNTRALEMMNDSFTRALDANTQQIFRFGESIEHGGRCPLPDCPFMNRETGDVRAKE